MIKKLLAPVAILILIFSILFLTTPSRKIGTGILLDNAGRFLALNSLVENASTIVVKFPNADNINAIKKKRPVSSFLSVLKLETPPKIERISIRFSTVFEAKNGDYLFALFYPITNTQEDKHILKEGNILSTTGPDGDNKFFEINFPIKPGQEGAAIFNNNREVIGIALSPKDIQKTLDNDLKISTKTGYGLKISSIKNFRKIIPPRPSLPYKSQPNLLKNLSYFIEGVQKNILLIETGS